MRYWIMLVREKLENALYLRSSNTAARTTTNMEVRA